MRSTWRWFGPDDPISLDAIRQTGVEGVVHALHELAPGTVWTRDKVAARLDYIHANGLRWPVVESLPVSDDIKRGGPMAQANLDAWAESLEAIAACPNGPRVIAYNFMPVLDWTRTDLALPVSDGRTTLAFDPVAFAAFDIHLLGRAGAEAEAGSLAVAARKYFDSLDIDAKARLSRAVCSGLPGGNESRTPEGLLKAIASFDGIDAADLRRAHHAFVKTMAPLAASLGLRLACHPDDPPWPLLGLPRVVSSLADIRALLSACDDTANGITLCTGSFCAGDVDVMDLWRLARGRVPFLHLRNVLRGTKNAFQESGHLDGDVDITELIEAIIAADEAPYWRPDHGLQYTNDPIGSLQPGYSYIGRLIGMAEIRGIAAAIERLRSLRGT